MLPKILAELLNLSNHQEDLIESGWRGVDLFRSEDFKTFQVNKNLEMATTTKLRQWFCSLYCEAVPGLSGDYFCPIPKKQQHACEETWRDKLYLFPAN